MKRVILLTLGLAVLFLGCDNPTTPDPEPLLEILPVFHEAMATPSASTRSIQVPEDYYTDEAGNIDNTEVLVNALTPAILGFRSAGADEIVKDGSSITAKYIDTTFTFEVTRSEGTFELVGSATGQDDSITLTYTPSTKEFTYVQNVILYQDNDPAASFDDTITSPQNPIWMHSTMTGTVDPSDLSVHCTFEFFMIDSGESYALVNGKGEFYSDGTLSGIYVSMPDFLGYRGGTSEFIPFGPLDTFPTIADTSTLIGADFSDAAPLYGSSEQGQFVWRNVQTSEYFMTVEGEGSDPWTPIATQ